MYSSGEDEERERVGSSFVRIECRVDIEEQSTSVLDPRFMDVSRAEEAVSPTAWHSGDQPADVG